MSNPDKEHCEFCDTDHRDTDGTLTPCFDSIIGTIAVGEIIDGEGRSTQ